MRPGDIVRLHPHPHLDRGGVVVVTSVSGGSVGGRRVGRFHPFTAWGSPLDPLSDMTEKKCCAEQKGRTQAGILYTSTKQVNKLTMPHIYFQISSRFGVGILVCCFFCVSLSRYELAFKATPSFEGNAMFEIDYP